VRSALLEVGGRDELEVGLVAEPHATRLPGGRLHREVRDVEAVRVEDARDRQLEAPPVTELRQHHSDRLVLALVAAERRERGGDIFSRRRDPERSSELCTEAEGVVRGVPLGHEDAEHLLFAERARTQRADDRAVDAAGEADDRAAPAQLPQHLRANGLLDLRETASASSFRASGLNFGRFMVGARYQSGPLDRTGTLHQASPHELEASAGDLGGRARHRGRGDVHPDPVRRRDEHADGDRHAHLDGRLLRRQAVQAAQRPVHPSLDRRSLLAAEGPQQGDKADKCIWDTHPSGGGLRDKLGAQGYSVHEASYGSAVGEDTDLFHWPGKFSTQMDAILALKLQDERLAEGQKNHVVAFKSCFRTTCSRAKAPRPATRRAPSSRCGTRRLRSTPFCASSRSTLTRCSST
jgi:hypothetical protein